MPKIANPFTNISKRLVSLQAKSVKINEELSALVAIVEAEMQKQAEGTPPAPAAKKAATKKSSAADPATEPKKRGRPAKK